MPRLTNAVPKYRRHKKSGQAFVMLSGQQHYLGPYGSQESRAKYDRLIAEYLAGGRSIQQIAAITVNQLAADFIEHVQEYYVKDGKPTTEQAEFRRVLRTACRMYGDDPVEAFGPLALKACRQEWIDAGVTRETVNKRQGRLVRMFKWGVAEELVSVSVWERLRAVDTLHVGRQDVPEQKEVPPVDLDHVRAVLPFCSPTVRAMIGLQILTGMRPGEVCKLRPEAIDRSAEVWEYRIQSHKTAHHGRTRVVYIGPEAQVILTPYLLRASSEPCFSPAESREWFRAKAEAERVTPPSCGNRRGKRHGKRKPAANPRKPSSEFSTGTYGAAIARACLKAFPVPEESTDEEQAEWIREHKWRPNQIRHTRGTEIRRLYGIEAAQVILGHAKADVTQIYAERDRQKAIEITRQIG